VEATATKTTTAKASVEATATKTSTAKSPMKTTTAKTTTTHASVNRAGSCHRTYEREGGKRDHRLS
jgi:hypothetical protein